MKNQINFKTIYYPLFVLFILLNSNLVVAQQTNAEKIVGSWVFEAEASFSSMNKKASDFMNKNPQLKLQIQSAYIGKTITFLSNGNYSQTLGDGAKSSGQWKLNGSTVLIAAPDGAVFSYNFNLSNTNLLLTAVHEQGKSVSIVPNQYFIKI
ncbi:hypothetical protein [uncultured Croceitalea sp.]|uniref:hypothetical protein n=1 Tax=uncultured Croceitalea sp. TaxID=1798908 RepID=UPI00374E4FA7